MATQVASGFCTVCDEQVRITRKGTNHILHLLLTLITCGLWVIVWVLTSIKIGGWTCVHCGENVARKLWA